MLEELRWDKGKVKCMHCDSENVVCNGTKDGHQRYLCKDCGRFFNITTGTIFANSNMQLNEWFYIARELQRGISINQISKELGRSYQHVMHAAHKIMDSVFMKRLIELTGEDIEVDEMYQSAGQKGKKCNDREPRKRGLKLRGRGMYAKDKPPIVAAVSRDGKTVIEVFKNLCRDNMDAFLYLITGRFIHTDDFRIYRHLDESDMCMHESVNHSNKRYAECYKHSNTVEGMFGDLRTWLRRYKGVCKDKLYRFVSLFQFNYNHREMSPMNKFISLMNTTISHIR